VLGTTHRQTIGVAGDLTTDILRAAGHANRRSPSASRRQPRLGELSSHAIAFERDNQNLAARASARREPSDRDFPSISPPVSTQSPPIGAANRFESGLTQREAQKPMSRTHNNLRD